MAAFKFKLEPVLRHRQMIEDQRQREMARFLRQKLIIETQLRNLQQTVTDDKRAMVDSLVGKVNVRRIRQHGVHSNQMTLRIQMMAVELFKLEQEIDKARAVLLDATKGRKAVELLRNKQLRRWQDERNRQETRQLDEFAMQSYIRSRSDMVDKIGVAI